MKLPSKFLSGIDIDQRWFSGPFANIKQMLPKQKGKRSEEITRYILAEHGRSILPPENSDHDSIADGKKIEIKGSFVTTGTDDCFSFLQIRPLQDYDTLLLVTFWFDGTIKIFELTKSDIASYIENNTFKKQHEGKKGAGSTYLYTGPMTKFEKHLLITEKIENEI